MKKLMLFWVLLGVAHLTYGQIDLTKEGLHKDLEDYAVKGVNMDIEGTLDYMPPAFFEQFPRELMVTTMENTFSDTTLRVKINSMSIDKVDKIFRVNGIYYAGVEHSSELSFIFLGQDTESEDISGIIKTLYYAQFGEENVIYYEEEKRFDIKSTGKLIAIGDPALDTWKFIESKEEMRGYLKEIIPAKVYKRID